MSYLDDKNKNLSGINPALIQPYLKARGYFTEVDLLPGYVNPIGMDGISLDPINWKKTIPRTSSIDILIEKHDKGLRKFSLMHPFIYLHLVNEILDNLDSIKQRLLRPTGVKAYSIPTMIGYEDISEPWKYFSRIDPANYFLSHNIIATTDISNFYGSIYTHSVSWAIHGRDEAKNNSRDFSLVGNRIDKLLQNAHDGQTNGIPVGNVISDVVAELILKDIDESITPLINRLDIKAFRYKDDYRFVCKNMQDARTILDELALELNTNYGLALNQVKTSISTTSKYIEHTTKSTVENIAFPEGLREEKRVLSGRELHDFIRSIESLSGKAGRAYFDTNIERLVDKLRKESAFSLTIEDDINEWAQLIFVMLINAADAGISMTPHAYLLMDFVLGNMTDGEEKKRTLDNLYLHTITSSNVSRKLWVYTVLLNHDRAKAKVYASLQDSPLFQIADGNAAKHIDIFQTRDPILQKELSKFSEYILMNFDMFGKINGQEDIFTLLEDDFYESLAKPHYDD